MRARQGRARARTGNPVDAYVGQLIRLHRINRGLSQAALAARLGISFQQVQKYEKGVNRIGAGRLYDIARIFEVPIETLFPSAVGSSDRARDDSKNFREVADFASSAEGLDLCLSYLRVDNVEARKQIVSLIRQLGSRE
jgi:transcriptional regulator with XRE-family HTH domain